jgi:gas vesicle protein
MLLAFLGGAAAGAAIGYLTAPRSGAETRQWMRDSIAAKREEIASLPPAMRAAYDAATSAAKEAYKESMADQAGKKASK